MREKFLILALVAIIILAACAPDKTEASAEIPFEVAVTESIWRNAPEDAKCYAPNEGIQTVVQIPTASGEIHDGIVVWNLNDNGKFSYRLNDLTAQIAFEYEADFRGAGDLWIRMLPDVVEYTYVSTYRASFESLDLFHLDNLNGITLYKIICY